MQDCNRTFLLHWTVFTILLQLLECTFSVSMFRPFDFLAADSVVWVHYLPLIHHWLQYDNVVYRQECKHFKLFYSQLMGNYSKNRSFLIVTESLSLSKGYQITQGQLQEWTEHSQNAVLELLQKMYKREYSTPNTRWLSI